MIYSYQGVRPEIPESAVVAEEAFVLGRVKLGERVSLWPGAVLRGDVNEIVLGGKTNVQDGAVLHVDHGGAGRLVIGERVTIGHNAVLHACTVEESCLIGIGAAVLDGAVIGHHSIVAAGALVVPGTVIPSGSMVMGSPARVRRSLTEEEQKGLEAHAERYVEYARAFRESAEVMRKESE